MFASASDRNGFDVILTFHSLAFHHDSLFFARFVLCEDRVRVLIVGIALDMLEGRSVYLFASRSTFYSTLLSSTLPLTSPRSMDRPG